MVSNQVNLLHTRNPLGSSAVLTVRYAWTMVRHLSLAESPLGFHITGEGVSSRKNPLIDDLMLVNIVQELICCMYLFVI